MPDRSILRFAEAADGRVVIADLVPATRATGPLRLSTSDLRPVASDGEGADSDEHFIAYGLRLGGAYVLAAQSDERVSETREVITEAFAVAALVAIALSVAGGALLGWLSLRRIEGFNRAANAIFAGAIDRRMPVAGSDDEMDRLADNLNRMLDRIERLMAGMRQVSTDIAHDLRTPLGRLRQKLETLARADADRGERRLAEEALGEADAILETFGALLNIAQLESGSQQPVFATVDLSALLTQVAEIYEPVANAGRRSLEARIDPGVLFEGDRALLLQLFVNLVENALTHTPAGSRVAIALEAEVAGWSAEVADDGPGVPVFERDRVFDRFVRLERSRSTPGTGLGLAVAKAIAELHGVAIVMEDNAPGLRLRLRFASRSPS